MEPSKRSLFSGFSGPTASAHKKSRANFKSLKIPSPVLFQNYDRPDDSSAYILNKRDGKSYHLTFWREGNFHKVFEIEGKPDRLIKAPNQIQDPVAIKKSYLETTEALKVLEDRTDLRVYKIYNKFIEDGFYEIENIPGTFTCGDSQSLVKIREIVAKMVTNPETFLFDFFPRNVHRAEDGEVVVIDPSDRKYCLDEDGDCGDLMDVAEAISQYIMKWSDNNPECIQDFVNDIDQSKLEGKTIGLYNIIVSKLPKSE